MTIPSHPHGISRAAWAARDRDAPDPSPPADNACGGLPTRIEAVSQESLGSQRWYVVIDVPPSLIDEVRRSRDNDYGRQIGRDETAPPATAIAYNEQAARR